MLSNDKKVKVSVTGKSKMRDPNVSDWIDYRYFYFIVADSSL